MDQVEIRRNILKIVYDLDKISRSYPVDSRDLMEKLDLNLDELFSNAKYLEGDGYLELKMFMGNEFKAKITAAGRDKVEKMGY
jgi:hypothetical protein